MCTRVVYSGSNGMVATGRSMDWKKDMHSHATENKGDCTGTETGSITQML